MYQRSVSVTDGDYEPPETATPELDDEATEPVDDDSPLELLELEVVLEVVEPEAVVALAVALDDEAETPGMVSALTVPNMPTPATAATAMPAVM